MGPVVTAKQGLRQRSAYRRLPLALLNPCVEVEVDAGHA